MVFTIPAATARMASYHIVAYLIIGLSATCDGDHIACRPKRYVRSTMMNHRRGTRRRQWLATLPSPLTSGRFCHPDVSLDHTVLFTF
jgi:hypothetical protein